jgi:hypothetical protein
MSDPPHSDAEDQSEKDQTADAESEAVPPGYWMDLICHLTISEWQLWILDYPFYAGP